jgi:hypothetical protein
VWLCSFSFIFFLLPVFFDRAGVVHAHIIAPYLSINLIGSDSQSSAHIPRFRSNRIIKGLLSGAVMS